jgi:hypothetical protein
MIEEEDSRVTGPGGIIRTSEGDQKFEHLLGLPAEEAGRGETGLVPDSKKTRYMTTTR